MRALSLVNLIALKRVAMHVSIYFRTRSSAIADKPRDAFVQYAMAWLIFSSICVTMPNSTASSQTVWALVSRHPRYQKLGSVGAPPIEWGSPTQYKYAPPNIGDHAEFRRYW